MNTADGIPIPRTSISCDRCAGLGRITDLVDGREMRRIRQRLRPDLSLRRVADKINVSPAYLSDMELGRRAMPERVAEAVLELCREVSR